MGPLLGGGKLFFI